MEDVGPEVAKSSGGLTELAKCSLQNPEQTTHALLVDKLKLALPLPLKQLPLPNEPGEQKPDTPCIFLRDWARFLLRTNNWHILCGLPDPDERRQEAIWTAFWEKYRAVEPMHPIYEMARQNKICLARCAAILLHSDEGRGRRRQSFLVVSYHSALGKGTRSSNARKVQKPWLKMSTNYCGHTFTTRFLCGVLPKASYVNDDVAFQSLLQVAASEALFMTNTGVPDKRGRKHFMVLLKVVGDWPWHHKGAGFTRSFNNVLKFARPAKKAPVGVCHLCKAGQDHYPIEQFLTKNPNWVSTMFTEPPFEKLPALAQVPHPQGKLENMWAFDVFHCWNLGTGKHYLGSVLALLSLREPGSNVDLRFNMLSSRYRMWCRENHRTPIIAKITKETINWTTSGVFPVGSWFKASLTDTLVDWVLDRYENENFEDEPLLVLACEAGKAMREALRILYAADFWVPAQEAKLAAQLGLKFLRRYSQAGTMAMEQNRMLFIVMPKAHALQHVWLELLTTASANDFAVNPISFAVAMSEDFIGKQSRVSRKVSSMTVVRRTIERYLQSAYDAWVSAGLIAKAA